MKLLRWFLFIMLVISACKEKYVSGVTGPATGFLVVEGFINVGGGETDISLTRTTTLDSASIIPETGAQVAVQSGNGMSYPLTETDKGKYSLNQLPVDPSQQYKLFIKTTDGKQYISDTSSVEISPPIDTVSWTTSSDGLNIAVSTHDDQAKALYYKWDFTETWEYHAIFYTQYEYDLIDSTFFMRPIADSVPNTCWNSDSSNTILIASTSSLAKDIITNFPLTFVPYFTTNKLISRYSILVKQIALSKDWYEWIQKVQKNTEQLGSIFDAQPSQTGGNFHCITNPSETVIGFVGCSTETEKRIFISYSQLPSVDVYSGYASCSLIVIPNLYDSIKPRLGADYISDLVFDANRNVTQVIIAPFECVDCRRHGGINIKPDFW